jgi:hypothetical protein
MPMASDCFPSDTPVLSTDHSVQTQDTISARSSMALGTKESEVSSPTTPSQSEIFFPQHVASTDEEITASFDIDAHEATDIPSFTTPPRDQLVPPLGIGNMCPADYILDKQEQMSTAGDLLLALGEQESACSVHLALYELQKS